MVRICGGVGSESDVCLVPVFVGRTDRWPLTLLKDRYGDFFRDMPA